MMRAGRSKAFVFAILAVLVVCIGLVWYEFARISNDYHEGVANESAEHLIETNAQVKLFLEELFANDHEIALSLANSISVYKQDEIDGILTLIRRERDIWGLSDVYIYAENGFCIGTEGDVKRNDAATDIIYYARKHGEYMSIVQSTITYSLPIENALMLNGSPLAAVSIVKEIDTLVDDMGFSSFDGEAYIYLTQDNGAIISKLTHPKASSTYNIRAILEQYEVLCLSHGEHTIDGHLPNDEACAFLYPDDDGDMMYLVVTPIRNGSEIMRLFYFVPEEAVNRTMLGFSSTITRVSIVMIAVFIICGALAFALLYRDRKRSFDSAIVARDRMLDRLVSNTSNVFALLSAKQRKPLYISSNAETILGDKSMWLERTAEGMSMAFPSGHENEAVREISQALKSWDGKSDFTSGFTPYSASGAKRYFIMRIYPVGDTDDEYVAIAQDVTQEREREETLRSALRRADAASLAKTRFLANMSHDIRTPMNAIINMTDFAIETQFDKEQQMEYLHVIRESADHLLRLINDILDMSRIESGQVVAASVPFDMRACLSDICGIIAPLYKAKHQQFTASFDSIATVGLIGDKVKLTRVLVNLLNNAIKFTDEYGSISLTVDELPSLSADSAAFRFTVKDNGRGIAKDYFEHIFEPFSRVEAGGAHSEEGSGLGLSICRSYVVALGGSITCDSELGKGSAFTVELFFKKSDAQTPAGAAPEHRNTSGLFSGKRALLCEDQSINQTIACRILDGLGFTVDVTCDGSEAVSAFEASPPGCYDIIYMDIQMPVMDGYEAARMIRKSARPDAETVPIIAMTANVFAEDVEAARGAGMNGHLGKPLRVNELVEISERVINKKEDAT